MALFNFFKPNPKNNSRKQFQPVQIRNSETRNKIKRQRHPKININLKGSYPSKPHPLLGNNNYTPPNSLTRQQSFFRPNKTRKNSRF